ncbi:hypothetical protein ACHAXM_006851 [Skeletonema potamos]
MRTCCCHSLNYHVGYDDQSRHRPRRWQRQWPLYPLEFGTSFLVSIPSSCAAGPGLNCLPSKCCYGRRR